MLVHKLRLALSLSQSQRHTCDDTSSQRDALLFAIVVDAFDWLAQQLPLVEVALDILARTVGAMDRRVGGARVSFITAWSTPTSTVCSSSDS